MSDALNTPARALPGAGCGAGPHMGLEQLCLKRSIAGVYVIPRDYVAKRHLVLCEEHLPMVQEKYPDLLIKHGMVLMDIPTWQQYALDIYGRLPYCACVACEPEVR